MTHEPEPGPMQILMISDFVCPWCYLGLVEIERVEREWEVEVRHVPYLLDPSTPPEGKPRRPMTRPDDPPTHMELRAEAAGIRFTRGRTWTSNSVLAHEGAEFAQEAGRAREYAREMFRAYFTELEDIGKPEVVVAVGERAGLDGAAWRAALEGKVYRQRVLEAIGWTREAGVTGVPTFVFGDRFALSGAQDAAVFDSVLSRLGARRR
ncbi:DsbA family oxidoreductase [Tepidiforma sp.]|uniref:DsbA family oxidoreductase n=1 Tax=Tepidiforma sp. TaxID=2682230 RepID=UPI002ADE7870|nr:DsbA family oxidoreductase [Tepidiforma sp.]